MNDSDLAASTLTSMREDWNRRARENAEYYIHTGKEQWSDREFFRSGEINVANEIMSDMQRICGGTRSPLDLDALEIGCGIGRMTRMMARIFRSVTALDVSTEMVKRATSNLKDLDNVTVVLGDGATLSALAAASYDFAFSFIVFQHIPTFEVVASYCREVYRVLRPGGLFKFQLQGAHWRRDAPPDTWHGRSFSEEESRSLCQDTGFIFEHSDGVGSQIFWLWFRKPS